MHGTSCTVGVCSDDISTTIYSKVYEMENMKEVDELTVFEPFLVSALHGIFTLIVVYKCSVINNRPLSTENSGINIDNKSSYIQVENRNICFHPSSIQLTDKINRTDSWNYAWTEFLEF